MICIHCFVTGKVQGVWFRASTKEKAESLALTGWARNVPDGRVEVLACGEREKISELIEWLKVGPALAEVKEVVCEEVEVQEMQEFKTL